MPALPQKITPCLWFDGNAEEAAAFYTALLPDSRIDHTTVSPVDTPGGKAGTVLTVEFTLAGSRYLGINGGPNFTFNEAVSFQIACDDQAEVDQLWDTLAAEGGQPIACGWIKDHFGLFWQITPTRLPQLIKDSDRDKAARAMTAMMQMVKIDIAQLEAAAAEPA